MSETVLLWVLGGQLAMIVGLAKLWWDHVRECRARGAELAVIRTQLDAVMKEIGDHEHGIRGNIHRLRADLSPFVLWAQKEMQK